MLRTGVVHSSQVSFIGTETLKDRHGIINLPSTCHRTAATDDDALAVSPHRFPAIYLERLAADRPNNGEPQYEYTQNGSKSACFFCSDWQAWVRSVDSTF
jgi:hypothetical protein